MTVRFEGQPEIVVELTKADNIKRTQFLPDPSSSYFVGEVKVELVFSRTKQ